MVLTIMIHSFMTMDDYLWLSIKWRVHYDGWLSMIMNAWMNGTDYNDPPLMDYLCHLCLSLSMIMILIHNMNGTDERISNINGLSSWIMVDMDYPMDYGGYGLWMVLKKWCLFCRVISPAKNDDV